MKKRGAGRVTTPTKDEGAVQSDIYQMGVAATVAGGTSGGGIGTSAGWNPTHSNAMARIQSNDSIFGGDRFGSSNSLHGMDRVCSLSSLTRLLEAHNNGAADIPSSGALVGNPAGGFQSQVLSRSISQAFAAGLVSAAADDTTDRTPIGDSIAGVASSAEVSHVPLVDSNPAHNGGSAIPTNNSAGSLLLSNVVSASNLLALSESHRGVSSQRPEEFFHVPSSQSIWNNPAFPVVDLSQPPGTGAYAWAPVSESDAVGMGGTNDPESSSTPAALRPSRPSSGALGTGIQHTPRYHALHGVPSFQSFTLSHVKNSFSELPPSQSMSNLEGLQWNESMPDLITYLNSQLRKSESALVVSALPEKSVAEKPTCPSESSSEPDQQKSDLQQQSMPKFSLEPSLSSKAAPGSARTKSPSREEGTEGIPRDAGAINPAVRPVKKRRARKRHQETINRLKRMLNAVRERANVVMQLSNVYLAEARYLAETQHRIKHENAYMLSLLKSSGLGNVDSELKNANQNEAASPQMQNETVVEARGMIMPLSAVPSPLGSGIASMAAMSTKTSSRGGQVPPFKTGLTPHANLSRRCNSPDRKEDAPPVLKKTKR